MLPLFFVLQWYDTTRRALCQEISELFPAKIFFFRRRAYFFPPAGKLPPQQYRRKEARA